MVGSTTATANPAATAASAALPPSSRIATPASVAKGCADETMPALDWPLWRTL